MTLFSEIFDEDSLLHEYGYGYGYGYGYDMDMDMIWIWIWIWKTYGRRLGIVVFELFPLR
jgi:hypothetical protein